LRKRITVAPYLHGEGAEEYIFNIYKKCDLILGNRFHSNVCAIGLGVPSVGLLNYPQIEKLYADLKLIDRLIQVNKQFKNDLKEITLSSLLESKTISENYNRKVYSLKETADTFQKKLLKWFQENQRLQT
jgi:polysaccharide pyruvyl transferase WcaK-like protein